MALLRSRAHAEQAPAMPTEYVTRQELDARDRALAIIFYELECARERGSFADGSLRYRLDRLIGAASEYKLAADVLAELKRIDKLMDAASNRDGTVQRNRASSRATSAKAFHF